MSIQFNRITLTVIILAALAALGAGLFVSQCFFSKRIDVNQFHGTLLNKPRDVNPFDLQRTDEQPFNNASLNGQWTMMFFGFTSCGYLCPATMAELGKMYRLLESKGIKKLPNVVMVSIDPERDDLNKLHHYVKGFDAHFYGARGNRDAIKTMTRELGIAYAKVALNGGEDAQNYDIEHTGTVLLFNPKGELSAFFTTPHNAESLAEDYQLLIS